VPQDYVDNILSAIDAEMVENDRREDAQKREALADMHDLPKQGDDDA
jgi:hypothetical protein